jgi:methylmalonyl-CoA mutase C-terminal domain/subunit
MEVIYTGLRQSPAAIARSAVQEAADVVGLSILSGAHLPLTRGVVAALRNAGADDITVIVGGNIPRRDFAALADAGAAAVFATGARFEEILEVLGRMVRP